MKLCCELQSNSATSCANGNLGAVASVPEALEGRSVVPDPEASVASVPDPEASGLEGPN
jgi:hypothetical protein